MGGWHGGGTHRHNFSPSVEQHWGRNPGGYSVHHEGYYHYDMPDNVMTSCPGNQACDDGSCPPCAEESLI